MRTILNQNSGVAAAHSDDHALEFFSKAGSLIADKRKTPKADQATALSLFTPAWMAPGVEGKTLAMQLLFWLRDPRLGSGSRQASRDIMRWIADQPNTGEGAGDAWLVVNLTRIPFYGRWDDLRTLFGTSLEQYAAAVWGEAIRAEDHLACKWAKCDYKPLQRYLDVNEEGLRKLIVPPRSTIVERKMCAQLWDDVDYSKLPSQAMKLYRGAFRKRDGARFQAYLDALERGDKGVKMNATTLWPHQCMPKANKNDNAACDAMFAALPDYIGPTKRKIFAIADTSASMTWHSPSPNVTLYDASVALAAYVSDRIGKSNPFYRKFMEFSTSNAIINWGDRKFSSIHTLLNNWCESTNVTKALDALLDAAVAAEVKPADMITHLLIMSDMQFDAATFAPNKRTGGVQCRPGCIGTEATVVESAMLRWQAYGYNRPNIIFWNLAGYAGNVAKLSTPNTALISGFSTSILSSVLTEKTQTPLDVMHKALSKFDVVVPVLN